MGEDLKSGPVASRPSHTALKWAAVAAVAGLVLAGVAAYVVWSNAEDWAKRKVVDAAKQQGIVLEVNDIDVSLRNLHVREARARLDGVEGVTAYLQNIDIGLSNFKPQRIQLDGVILQTVGATIGPHERLASVAIEARSASHVRRAAKTRI